MTKKEKGQSQGPHGHHRLAPTGSTSAEFERIAKSTRADRVLMPDLGRASRSVGHGLVIATEPCLLPIDTLSRAVLKLTTERRSNGLLPRVPGRRRKGGLVSLVVPYAVLITCRRPCTHSPH